MATANLREEYLQPESCAQTLFHCSLVPNLARVTGTTYAIPWKKGIGKPYILRMRRISCQIVQGRDIDFDMTLPQNLIFCFLEIIIPKRTAFVHLHQLKSSSHVAGTFK